MAKKRRGLGNARGIDKLLGEKAVRATSGGEQRIEQLPVEQLQPGQYQPRQQFDQVALDALADSIRAQGMVQPIVARRIDDDRYEIIAGERRWRAAQKAGLDSVPVIVRQADNQATLAMALIENVQREDLNPIEQAQGLARLLDEFSLTHEQLAEAVGVSRAQVSNLLRLLKLPEMVQAWVHDGLLSMGHARALLTLPESAQLALGQRAIDEGWSVRQLEAAVQRLQEEKPKKRTEKDPNIVALEQRLAEQLSAKVAIRHGARGRGKLEIRYSDLDELQRILDVLGVQND